MTVMRLRVRRIRVMRLFFELKQTREAVASFCAREGKRQAISRRFLGDFPANLGDFQYISISFLQSFNIYPLFGVYCIFCVGFSQFCKLGFITNCSILTDVLLFC